MKKEIITLVAILGVLFGCTSYKTQYAGFRPADDYPNRQTVNDLTVGAEVYAGKATAKEAFGFDIQGTGLLPVQVVMNNQSAKTFEIHAAQTFLKDQDGRLWNVISNKSAVERIDKATQTGAIGRGAGKGAMWGAAGGAVLGAAVGVISGKNVMEAAGKGAAVGGAGGAVYGGTKGGTDSGKRWTIADDIREKGLEGKIIPPQALANGFLFFPAEAKTAKELRLQLREKDSAQVHTLTLPF